MENKLEIFFRRFTDSVIDFYDIPEIVKFLQTEIERKRKIYPYWKKKVRFSYAAYQKTHSSEKKTPPQLNSHPSILQYFYHDDRFSEDKQIPDDNINKIIPFEDNLESIPFFKKKSFDFFSYFFTEIMPFDQKELSLTQFPTNIYKDIFLDFRYNFSDPEILAISQLKRHYQLLEKLEKIIEYLFSCFVHIYGIELGGIIPENFQIELISAVSHLQTTNHIDFVITIRQRERNLKDFFLNSHIYQFSEYFGQIPSTLKNKLKMQKDLVYLFALERYFTLKPDIISVLARVFKKSIALRHITPILDILNFVFSRVEDSEFDTQDILKEVTEKYTDNPQKQAAFRHLFNFCNKNAVLFGTFQSNNRSQLEEQFRLFFLYNLQFFGERATIGQTYHSDVIFLPETFRTQINDLEQQFPLFKQYFCVFQNFLHAAFEISSNPAFRVVFKYIFRNKVEDMNEDFFSAFISSLNERLLQEIKRLNEKINGEGISYSNVVDFIIKTIYHSVNTIFLADDPLQASKNFKDSISRYSPKNIALRALELLFFKEIPLSDNNWMNYNLSRNKEKVINQFQDYLRIPKDYFFSNKKLLHISMKQFYSIESEIVLEKWFVKYIILPFITFTDRIYKEVKKKGQILTKDNIVAEMNFQISRGIINTQTLDYLEVLCEKMAESFTDALTT
ncbi:MAG: hypothetical protein JW776_09815 [Candidatus Lokiarchaeota archaeon]|nr:hypothetical protein [Candidatus Lokiarchaeota archaeon]